MQGFLYFKTSFAFDMPLTSLKWGRVFYQNQPLNFQKSFNHRLPREPFFLLDDPLSKSS